MFYVQISVKRLRRTMKTVLTFDLEDLMAYTGGYLGLLLGSSILSIFTGGHKLVGRLARLVTRRRRRRERANQPEGTIEEGIDASQWFRADDLVVPPILTSEAWLTRPTQM